jgi:hypothetical protein
VPDWHRNHSEGAYHWNRLVTNAQRVAVRRALTNLKRKGLVEKNGGSLDALAAVLADNGGQV